MIIDKILEAYPDEEFLKADGFDDAVIGVEDINMRLVYDKTMMIHILEKEGMSETDAIEYLEYNTWNAYVGENTPIFVTTFNNNEQNLMSQETKNVHVTQLEWISVDERLPPVSSDNKFVKVLGMWGHYWAEFYYVRKNIRGKIVERFEWNGRINTLVTHWAIPVLFNPEQK